MVELSSQGPAMDAQKLGAAAGYSALQQAGNLAFGFIQNGEIA